jgi:hypothetical protein
MDVLREIAFSPISYGVPTALMEYLPIDNDRIRDACSSEMLKSDVVKSNCLKLFF